MTIPSFDNCLAFSQQAALVANGFAGLTSRRARLPSPELLLHGPVARDIRRVPNKQRRAAAQNRSDCNLAHADQTDARVPRPCMSHTRMLSGSGAVVAYYPPNDWRRQNAREYTGRIVPPLQITPVLRVSQRNRAQGQKGPPRTRMTF
jgi:hypothetical protein